MSQEIMSVWVGSQVQEDKICKRAHLFGVTEKGYLQKNLTLE